MGIRLIVEVMEHAPATLTWRECWVLGVLAENANDGTRECWPGIEDDPDIARKMRVPGRSSRYEVIKALRKKGALEGVSAGHRGRRAVYRIAVLAPVKGPGTPDAMDEKGSGNAGHSVQDPRTQSGGKGPQNPDPMSEKGSGNDPERVRESRTPSPHTPQPASQQAGSGNHGYGIPDTARPLVDNLTAAGVVVRWPFKGNGWFPVLSLINKSGVPAMVDHAVKAAARADVQSASYFMRGWSELPPLPPQNTVREEPAKPDHCGDPDCDPVSRTREREHPNGLRTNYPCPHCHPDTQKDTAA